jgi:hypothetical protein
MIKPLNQRVLRCVIGHRSGPHFGDVLGIQDAKLLLPESTASDDKALSVQFQYRVPARLCVHVPGAATIAPVKPELALSAAVALFDELSTRGLVLEDRHFRPGVSVHLSGQFHRAAHADDEVTITTISEKIGANLGFCTITMHSSKDSVLLYSGRHIKYLPMGRAWDRVMGSKPLVKALLAVVDDESGTTVNKLFGKRASLAVSAIRQINVIRRGRYGQRYRRSLPFIRRGAARQQHVQLYPYTWPNTSSQQSSRSDTWRSTCPCCREKSSTPFSQQPSESSRFLSHGVNGA